MNNDLELITIEPTRQADAVVIWLHGLGADGNDFVPIVPELGLPDDAGHVNPNGGAIALGHPLGMSGARLVTMATRQLGRIEKRYAICTMCVGVGQGIAMLLERA